MEKGNGLHSPVGWSSIFCPDSKVGWKLLRCHRPQLEPAQINCCLPGPIYRCRLQSHAYSLSGGSSLFQLGSGLLCGCPSWPTAICSAQHPHAVLVVVSSMVGLGCDAVAALYYPGACIRDISTTADSWSRLTTLLQQLHAGIKDLYQKYEAVISPHVVNPKSTRNDTNENQCLISWPLHTKFMVFKTLHEWQKWQELREEWGKAQFVTKVSVREIVVWKCVACILPSR